MNERLSLRRRADYRLLFLPLVISMIGLVMVHSASVNLALEQHGIASFYTKKQLIAFGLGVIAMLVLQSIDFRQWQKWAGGIWLFTIFILIAVLVHPNSSIRSWINIGPMQFQPAELAKLTVILFLAAWLTSRLDRLTLASTFWSFMAIIGILGVLSMLEPDFGTFIILVGITFTMYIVAGMNIRHLVIFFVVMCLGASYFIIRQPYRLARLTSFANPSADHEGTGYHLTNMFISVGSGSWWGVGLGNSKQKRFFLPEPHTDSIYAVTVEELGFVRAGLLLGLIFYYIITLFTMARRLEPGYARFVTVGFATWLFIQTLFNIGPVIGLLPLTGVPLPFVSYGGTSLLTLLAGSGILLNISKYAKT